MNYTIENVKFDTDSRVTRFTIRVENQSDVCVIVTGYIGFDKKIRYTQLYRESANEALAMVQAFAYLAAHEGGIIQNITNIRLANG